MPHPLQARVRSEIYKIEPPNAPAYVVVHLTIDCPVCGTEVLTIMGHHLKTIRDVAIEAIDLYPDLTSGATEVVDRFTLKGRGNDPANS